MGYCKWSVFSARQMLGTCATRNWTGETKYMRTCAAFVVLLTQGGRLCTPKAGPLSSSLRLMSDCCKPIPDMAILAEQEVAVLDERQDPRCTPLSSLLHERTPTLQHGQSTTNTVGGGNTIPSMRSWPLLCATICTLIRESAAALL
jgi:hypothetical protein